ncbi:hypothetical protein N9K16_01610 [Alphaproteobacteria bacterium]|nr:hypothetical protein [Alphaproteobacteria bacterium]
MNKLTTFFSVVAALLVLVPSANAEIVKKETMTNVVQSTTILSRLPIVDLDRSVTPVLLASAFCKKYHRDVRMIGGDTEMRLRKRALAEGCLGKKSKSKAKAKAKAKAKVKKKQSKSNDSIFSSTSEPTPIKRSGTTVTFKNQKQLCEWARFQFCYRSPGHCDFTVSERNRVRQQGRDCRAKGFW